MTLLKGRYDMILGRDLLTELGLNLKLYEHVIKGDGGPFNRSTITMVGSGRKVRTCYGSFLRHLELGQKLKINKNPFTDIIFRFQSTCHCSW